MDDGDVGESVWRGRHWGVLSAGAALLFASAATWGIGAGCVQCVDPSERGFGVVHEADYLGPCLVHALVIAVAILTCAAVGPRESTAHRASTPVGLWLIAVVLPASVGVGLGLANAAFFAQPDDGCAKPGCWPLYQQSALILTPALLTAVVAIVLALCRHRVPRIVRTCVPVLTWIAASVALRLCWLPLVVPWLTSGVDR